MSEAINPRCHVYPRPDGTWGMEVDGETVPTVCATRESALQWAESVAAENDFYAAQYAERVAAGCMLLQDEEDPMDRAMGYAPPAPFCTCPVCQRDEEGS